MSSIYSNMGSQYVVAAQPQPENATARTPSYAETTWLRVDDKARAILRSYGKVKIEAWTEKSLGKIISGTQQYITVRDARIINSYAVEQGDAPVFNITVENVVEFTVDQVIRNRLEVITFKEVQPVLDELGATEGEFYGLKFRNISVTTGDAEKYNNFLKWKLFDKERVFNLACNEPIANKKQKGAMIEITPDHRTKLKALSPECKQKLFAPTAIGKNFKNIMAKTKKISEENAELIDKISGQEIFALPKAKGEPALSAQGTKRPLAVQPGDPSELPLKKQKTDIYDVNAQIPQAQVFTYSIPQVPVFTDGNSFAFDEIPQASVFSAQPALSQELRFTPPIETNGSENSLPTADSSPESDELYYFDQLISVNSSSTVIVAPSIQEILPPSFNIYEDWDSLNM